MSNTAVSNNKNSQIFSDSLHFVDNSSFADVQLTTSISQKEFKNHKAKYVSGCVITTDRPVGEPGFYIIRNCHNICDTYLGEAGTNRKLLLPSTFDAGITNVLPSPDCKKLIVFSSYDMPDYENYYEHRAEFFLFNVIVDKGIEGIKPSAKHFSKKWSLADMTWINNKTIAAKVYENKNPIDKDYKYFIVDLIY